MLSSRWSVDRVSGGITNELKWTIFSHSGGASFEAFDELRHFLILFNFSLNFYGRMTILQICHLARPSSPPESPHSNSYYFLASLSHL